jgi:flagellar protein FlgJ
MDGKIFLDTGVSGLSAQRLENTRKAAENIKNSATSASGKGQTKEVEKAATDFEALLLQQMLQSMWSTIPKDGFLSGSQEEGMYRDMFHEALAKQLAEAGGIGVQDVLVKEIERIEKK